MLKDWPKVYRKLRRMHFANDDERILFARGLAASPQERWEMNENYLRANGVYGWKDRHRFYQIRRRLNDTSRLGLWKSRVTNEELAARHGFEP